MNNQTVQVAHFTGTVIPRGVLKQIRARALDAAYSDLENLLLWRDELEPEYKAQHGTLMKARVEFARAAMMSADTMRRKCWQIAGFSKDDLCRWLDSGLSFEHFEIAKSLAETAHKSPAQLLNEAIDMGDEFGGVMTVEKLTAHALGEREPRPLTYAALGWIGRLFDIPTRMKWDAEKSARWVDLMQQVKDFLK